ncbi:hypothetical protein B14911_02239 [Bacillus sp. NRRL B-14911]|uniref:Uncharacterized protein n=1 Tax=Bacillus infantis NRRL B-14911 TaxID=1367477 RepID=U5L442_9BACI|nr:hypothetical protein N288_00290 [Bacillus infantis NRRL B-14911]EAR63294.1 hypothetical protein B14911_02239 [Bacillus sp. NRRL B-14911]
MLKSGRTGFRQLCFQAAQMISSKVFLSYSYLAHNSLILGNDKNVEK